ncbi:MAG: translational GTPase TypA [SAR202 cluster bacterium]|nr:translational GTPase TypA [SAR202 cluster bacterium]
MTEQKRQDVRNIAIIAHVDHGKTTLVDALLKQSKVFRDNQVVGELIMDSNPLERERGITILAKNTAITYNGVKINIIDTPGHADFGGEVERALNMADGCLLIVDAIDGPMPQTRYVLHKALQNGLKPVVVINKIDRPNARIAEVEVMVQDLFLEVVTDADQLDYPVLYASAREGYARRNVEDTDMDMVPLFDAILREVPAPGGHTSAPVQIQVAALDYDNHLGQIALGRISRGSITQGQQVIRIDREGEMVQYGIERLYVYQGLARVEVQSADAGDIVAMAGVTDVSIGDTVADVNAPDALPFIVVDEPTVTITVGVNTSPFAGKDGNAVTARQLRDRLMRELKTNVSLRVEATDRPNEFLVVGRGELHLGILLETMRREGIEIEASRPQAITKIIDGKKHEPYEKLYIDTDDEFIGALTENLSKRLAKMEDMRSDGEGHVRMVFKVPTRGLIGFHSFFLRTVHGNGVMSAEFIDYEPVVGSLQSVRTGALVSSEEGVAITYGLNNAQGRGSTFVDAGTPVYEGMIVGIHPRDSDIIVNVCKEKKMSNVRSSTSDIAVRLTPPIIMSLEESLDFVGTDELVEITPKSIRTRKKLLGDSERRKFDRSRAKAASGYVRA